MRPGEHGTADRDDALWVGPESLGPDHREQRHDAQALQVWVYGDAAILLKLEEKDNPGLSLDISTERGDDAEGWNLLSFSLAGARARLDLSSVKMLFFLAPGDPSASGVIYFDDITLLY